MAASQSLGSALPTTSKPLAPAAAPGEGAALGSAMPFLPRLPMAAACRSHSVAIAGVAITNMPRFSPHSLAANPKTLNPRPTAPRLHGLAALSPRRWGLASHSDGNRRWRKYNTSLKSKARNMNKEPIRSVNDFEE